MGLNSQSTVNGSDKKADLIESLSEQITSLWEENERSKAEQLTLQSEIQRLRDDSKMRWGRWVVVTLLPTVAAAIITAVVSGGAVWLNWQSDIAQREEESLRAITKDFASDNSSVRAGAAVMLGRIVTRDSDDLKRSHATTLLLSRVGPEREFNVRQAIEDALLGVGDGITGKINERKEDLLRELIITFGRSFKPKCSSFGNDLPRLRAMQEGVLTLAKVVSKLARMPLDLKRGEFRCALLIKLNAQRAQMQDAVFWQADLSFSILRAADLTDAQIKDVLLFEADITDAKFCGEWAKKDLTIKMVQEAIGWEKAYYPPEFAAKLKDLTGKPVRFCSNRKLHQIRKDPQ